MNGWKVLGLLFCINFGIVVISFTGIWDIGVGAGSTYDIRTFVGTTIGFATIGAGAAGGGALVANFFGAGVNVMLAAAIGAFTTTVINIFGNTHRVLSALAASIDDQQGLASILVVGYIGFCTLILLVFLYQMATGGWKSYE